MTRYQLLNIDYIDFNNRESTEQCETLLKELLTKELYTSDEIKFLNTYLSSKFAVQENVDLQIQNIEFQDYISKFQNAPFLKQLKETQNYYEIMAQSKEIKEEDQERFIHTFHIDSYSYRNSRAYTFMIIFHEIRHILQHKEEKKDSKMVTYQDYIGYFENLIIEHDYKFYEENHTRFYKEKDANLYAIIKTIELLTQNSTPLSLLDKTVINYQMKKIFVRNSLKDRIIISEKVKEVISSQSKYRSIWPVYELEFNTTYTSNYHKKLQRKTIDQIIKEITINKENSKFYNFKKYYKIEEKLFDYIVLNAIYYDDKIDLHLQKLNKQEREIIIESLKRSEKNSIKYQYVLENQLKQQNFSSKDFINIILDSKKRYNYLLIMTKYLSTLTHNTSQKEIFNTVKTKIMK